MKKKLLVSTMIVTLMNQVQAADHGLLQSWFQAGAYSLATVLGSYGLFKGYKWYTYKEPVKQLTTIEKFVAKIPGGQQLAPYAQKAIDQIKNHPYTTAAAGLIGMGWLGYSCILKPELQIMRAKELKMVINNICNHNFARHGNSPFEKMTALATACAWAQDKAAELEHIGLVQAVNDLIAFYTKNQPTNPAECKNFMIELNQKRLQVLSILNQFMV
jgi:hypothetical protein